MWGKIARGLKDNAGDLAGDLRGGLAKLQDVVAPPHTPRDDRHRDENDHDEDEPDQVEQYRPSVVGFGAILSRIVAPPLEEDFEEYEEVEEVLDEEEEEEELYEEEVEDEEFVEDFHQEPSALDAQNFTTPSSRMLPPLDPSPMQSKPVKFNAETARLVVPPRTPIETNKLIVPTISISKITASPSSAAKKLIVPSKPLAQSTLSHQLSSMSLETSSLEGSSLPESSMDALLQYGSVQEKSCQDSLLLQQHAAKVQELEARDSILQRKATELYSIQQEKEGLILDLEQRCNHLQSRLDDEKSILSQKDDIISQLKAQCMKLQEQKAAEQASTEQVLQEKEGRICQLEETCQALQSKPWIDPKVVEEMNEKIRELEAQAIAFQTQSATMQSEILQEKDRKIRDLETKCRQMEESQLSSQEVSIQEKKSKISDLESECHSMRLEIERYNDQARLYAQQEASAKEQLAALEQKYHESQNSLDPNILTEKDKKIRDLEAQCQELHMEMKRQFDQARLQAKHTSVEVESATKEMVSALERKCNDLEVQLRQREDHILIMQKDAVARMEAEEEWRESQQLKFKQEQAEMLEANVESVSAEYRQEIERLETELESISRATQDQLSQERKNALQVQRKLEHQLEEVNSRMARMETEKVTTLSKSEAAHRNLLHKHEMAARQAEAKLNETKAILEDRNEELKSLKATVKELQSSMRKSKGSSAEIQEELEHLREENETLHHNWQVTEDENDMLKKQIDDMAKNEDVIADLRRQITVLKETKERERAEIESKVDSVESNKSALQEELDAARAQVRDLEHQLAAALADAEVARSDLERAIMGNENLSRALESFQSERDAEITLMEEQHRSSEEATAAAHAATVEAMYEANEMSMRQVRYAADAAVKQAMEEVRLIKDELEGVRKEKLLTRRSLDEAISRLQASQEDVVDRCLMKNVLLDWFARSGKSKEQVLEVMASLLHFTEEEKEKIHLYDGNRLSQVISSVATLPPPNVNVQNLEGANVRDKFVNFLLAETDDFP